MKDTPKKQREFGVVLESIDSKVQHIVEAVDTHTTQLQKLQSVPDSIDKIETRLDVIETILESVNLPALKQKVATLEKRMNLVEANQKS